MQHLIKQLASRFLGATILTFILCPLAAAEPNVPLTISEVTGEQLNRNFAGGIFAAGDLFLAGQPLSANALAQLKQQGVTQVINLRTPEEIANPKASPINVEQASRQLGLTYQHLPAGGEEYPYSPAMVDTLASILDDTDGKVLLHCASGRRATHLWVAYLIRYQNLPANEAVALGKLALFGEQPVEGFLGGPLHYEIEEPANQRGTGP